MGPSLSPQIRAANLPTRSRQRCGKTGVATTLWKQAFQKQRFLRDTVLLENSQAHYFCCSWALNEEHEGLGQMPVLMRDREGASLSQSCVLWFLRTKSQSSCERGGVGFSQAWVSNELCRPPCACAEKINRVEKSIIRIPPRISGFGARPGPVGLL